MDNQHYHQIKHDKMEISKYFILNEVIVPLRDYSSKYNSHMDTLSDITGFFAHTPMLQNIWKGIKSNHFKPLAEQQELTFDYISGVREDQNQADLEELECNECNDEEDAEYQQPKRKRRKKSTANKK